MFIETQLRMLKSNVLFTKGTFDNLEVGTPALLFWPANSASPVSSFDMSDVRLESLVDWIQAETKAMNLPMPSEAGEQQVTETSTDAQPQTQTLTSVSAELLVGNDFDECDEADEEKYAAVRRLFP
eukprot:c18551_g1_i4.p1 GENE.c18551_g1_i4~~c18551_g1_i4.p1  ORF type:complete len:126 (+),score=36.33 c18551_g1_i4:341-718(+)